MIRYTLLLIATYSTCLLSPLVAQVAAEEDQKFLHYIEPHGLMIIEKMNPGMTLYTLATRYQVSVAAILEVNPDLQPQAIPLGFPIQIPIAPAAISFQPPLNGKDSMPVFYRVEPKETLYRISKVYLGTSPENILSLNPRVKDGLSIGQVLHLGWYTPVQKVQPVSNNIDLQDSTKMIPTDYTASYKKEGMIIREQKGLAFWKPGQLQTQYYVLHATARPGSYMEITNPMLHKTITAKVAGNIPEGLYPAQVGLVVSPSVARALGVLDQQFFARWRFIE
jgi:LysM repeat protein